MMSRLLSESKNESRVPDQNILGFYLCLGIWIADIALCPIYYILGVNLGIISIFVLCAFVGFWAGYLFRSQRNVQAVLAQSILMLAGVTLAILLFPRVGIQFNYCLVVVAMFPVVLLERMHYGIVFVNLALCILILATSELLPTSIRPISEEIFLFLLKFAVLIFSFFHVYVLRIVLDRRQSY